MAKEKKKPNIVIIQQRQHTKKTEFKPFFKGILDVIWWIFTMQLLLLFLRIKSIFLNKRTHGRAKSLQHGQERKGSQ